VHRETQAKLEIMTFDPDIVTGKKVVGCLVDEVHVLGKMARASKAMIQLRGGMEPFPEAFLVEITTQSDEPPAGVFKEDLEKAREIRDGKRVSRMLPVLYEFPVEMQADPAKPWRDSANWGLVNPNAGRSVHIANLIERCADEELKGEAALRTWASQHLNVEIGVAMHANRWAGAEHWEKSGTGPKTLDELLDRSEVVVACADGGGLDDLLGFGAIGREIDTGNWLHWGKAWAHECVLERRKSEASKFRDFEAQGDLVVIPDGSEEDVEQLAAHVEQMEASGLLDRVGVDQAGLGGIVDAIVGRGIAHERIVAIPQGWRLVGAIKTAERKLAARTLLHAAQPLMAYSVSGAKVEVRSNAIYITKQIAGATKIDPLLAMFNGVALMSMNPQPRRATPSFRWAA
jgi:phage terminase large subunit-like protein